MPEHPWREYRRKGFSEMRPYVDGEVLTDVSVSAEDVAAGSPKHGDMIARNPKNHADQWLVAKQYFEDNLELRDALIEDRARFPDRPDGIGNMIGAHIGNLKAAAEQGKRDSLAAVQERDALAATMDLLKSLALDVADDLEAELKARYALPQQQRHYDRDMTTALALRAALEDTP